ncbi:MBL fold metallo-hydrolase [Paenibacillus lutimineralis]|uniref:MBL fold metallo-hydrolase n=1 Tax=Paenibacillus lutimineralis TaxID=2707005 RepID=A0A3S9V172_9BACL|nr:MBL fold metallo-hydrolase [Paenibacillus lutimineralis]AZS16313.1 MBL fold metallo-hydrolase [Paenibacillus lutimineralis]
MDLTVIGYWGAYPDKNEATSGYLLEHKGSKILLDCGSGVLSKLQNYTTLEELDAVVITHLHADHMADVYSLEFATLISMQLGRRLKPLEVYVYYKDSARLDFCYPQYVNVHQITPQSVVTVGELTLEFSENIHEVPCCAVKVISGEGKSLVYSGDTGYCQEIIDFSWGVDVLVLESSFYNWQKGLNHGHLTAGEAGQIAAIAQPGRLILTHLPHYDDHQQLVLEASVHYNGEIQLAYCGMKLTI